MSRPAQTTPPLGTLEPSMTLGITSKAKQMIRDGQDVANMCAGEPDFDTPEHIKRAAADALEQGETKYTPVPGRVDLREAIAEKLQTDNHLNVDPDNVVVAPGAKYSVFEAVVTTCGPGDQVLIPAPYWLSYPQMVTAAGAETVVVPTTAENEYCVTREALEAAVTTQTRLLILNSPGNPSGAVYKREQLADIAAFAVEHDILVLADEIYEMLVYDREYRHVSIGSLNDDIASRTITVNGFSKAYAMTGWRLGYSASPGWVAKRIKALQSHTTSNPTSFAQAGALAALRAPQDCVYSMRDTFAERRQRIHQLLSDIPGLDVFCPHGAFYIFPDIGAYGLDSMTFAERALNETQTAVVPGLPFGADTCIRLSYACSTETIDKACERLAGFCANL